jgi:hypothetical protein
MPVSMKKYIITSPKFTGHVDVLYGLDAKLLQIDFSKSDLSEQQIIYFKEKLPVFYSENFLSSFGTKNLLQVIEEGYRVSFEEFWERYDKKINKLRTQAAWNKLSEADQANAFFKLPNYERHLALNTWLNKLDPENYIKKRAWENQWK